MDFEWDEAKRRANLKKHGVDFRDAWRIFQGPLVEALDVAGEHGEDRIVAIGFTGAMTLVVVYTMRGETIRIISAWKASRNDEENYFAEIQPR